MGRTLEDDLRAMEAYSRSIESLARIHTEQMKKLFAELEQADRAILDYEQGRARRKLLRTYWQLREGNNG